MNNAVTNAANNSLTDHEGPVHADEGINFCLSRKEPAQGLMWMAGSMAVVLFFAWYGGKVDATYVLIFGGMFVFFYGCSWYDETNAEADRSIKLRIDREGIEIPDRFRGVMPWQGIESISLNTHKSTTTLQLVPTDPAAHGLDVKTGWAKFLSGDGVGYDITPLEGGEDDVRAALCRYAPGALTKDL